MNFDSVAQSYISQAEERFALAKLELERKKYNITVRLCQEVVELALKACLRIVNVEPPKFHDVGPVLKDNLDKFPSWFKERIEVFASYSRSLRKERELSMYGDEETNTPPEILYSEYDAQQSLKMAEEILDYSKKLFEEKKRR
ncbi:HEPN domain-containing protein [Metallosphaera hakonensis]|uniref:DNA-binding protein n=1 Tax=Metallosphaera hakonensis JCM 8857 = DSM 7519 TaxID=1293036 RepID=A0A2U9IRB4_9CREN|nr:HEPN domain-containing protein [Metallosphaera hakonensis]AWR98507.1 HEPN domain-containing protein [Metallosphaera hakonensis JCM 8857 = DSM 7519]